MESGLDTQLHFQAQFLGRTGQGCRLPEQDAVVEDARFSFVHHGRGGRWAGASIPGPGRGSLISILAGNSQGRQQESEHCDRHENAEQVSIESGHTLTILKPQVRP